MYHLSIIIPTYGLVPNLKSKCLSYIKLLNSIKQPYYKDFEIIIVFDGYNQEYKKLKKSFLKNKHIKIYSYSENQGKGYALIYGFKKAIGNIITFIDADDDIPLSQIINFFPYLSTNDIVIGSKRHPFSKIDYPLRRRILSRGFQLFSKIILNTSLRDTQSGLKVMRREVLDVLSENLEIRGFAFDLELCFLAQQFGFRIVEAPIQINFQGESQIKIRHIIKMALDTIKIRISFTLGKRYQKSFHKKNFD